MKKLLLFSMAIVMALSACKQNNEESMPEVGDKKYYDITLITPEGSQKIPFVSELVDLNDSTATFANTYTLLDGSEFKDTIISSNAGEAYEVSMKAVFTRQLMEFDRDSIEFVEGSEKVMYKEHIDENTVMDPARLVLKAKANGTEVMIELSVEERKVFPKEEVTTPAGTFNCIKFSENKVAKIGDQEFFSQTVYWYDVKNNVLVKQADYNKAGEPTMEVILTKEE
jgi:hypothetical protein